MSKLQTAKRLWKNNKRNFLVAIYNYIVRSSITNIIPDAIFLKMTYRVHIGKKLDFINPKGFNEKIQWLKLYYREPRLAKLVDKYEVKEYVGQLIGEQYIIPTLGVWDTLDEIDFTSLPNRFVIKCTHDSGSIIICKDKDKLDIGKAKSILNRALKRNMFYWGREWPYKNVKPRIIAESYMEDESVKNELIDYKFMCFNGEPKCVFTVTNRSTEMHVTFYDMMWNIMPFERHYPSDKEPLVKPASFDEMERLSRILSKDLPFARIDFYEIQKRPYFGEITLYPGNGVEEFTPALWDDMLGSWLQLPTPIKN